jgi:hypothetical protein
MREPRFFYRFDGLAYEPGYKSAGFCFVVDTQVLKTLKGIQVTPEEQARVIEISHTRIRQSGLLKKKLLRFPAIFFHENTACPRYFHTDSSFGGSVGADAETFGWLDRPDFMEWIGPEVAYTPHNVDAPSDTFMLTVLCQTWAEWAQLRLAALAHESEKNRKPA